MGTNVLLLRAPSEDDNGRDKYEDAFRVRGYRAVNVPVLETVHTNVGELSGVVRKGSSGYAGVIVTSGRAGEGWRLAVQQFVEDELTDERAEGWTNTPFYVVGEATASVLRGIPSSPYSPRDIRGGAESGTGEKLAHFIVSDLSLSPGSDKKLLYLVGDKNRDTVPTILRNAGFELETLQVYATQGSSRFEDDLRNALEGVQGLDPQANELWWIVHFAPSSAKYVSPILEKYFNIPLKDDVNADLEGNGNSAQRSRRARLAAIGPTTASSLESDVDMRIGVVAAKPTPEALAEGIAKFDENRT